MMKGLVKMNCVIQHILQQQLLTVLSFFTHMFEHQVCFTALEMENTVYVKLEISRNSLSLRIYVSDAEGKKLKKP
jgi:hypothetical protein